MSKQEQHFFGNINQKALIRKDGQILLQRFPDSDPNLKGKWDMPGGRLNVGESSHDGLKREVFEEIGAEIEIVEVVASGIYENMSGVPNFFLIYDVVLLDENKPFVMEAEEVAEIRWVTEKELFEIPIVFPEYKKALEKILKRK